MRAQINLCLLALLICGGCATKVVGIYNDDVARKRSKTFFLQGSKYRESLTNENKKLDSLLQSIITSQLRKIGLKQSSLPDIYVSYIVNVFSSSETKSNNNPYSYTYPSAFNYTTRNYKEGVLIIDIRNDEGILVWQGSKTFKLRSKLSVHDLLPKICQEIIETYETSK